MNRRRTAGRRKPILDRKRKNIAATGEPRVQARVHLANVPPLPYPFPIVVNHGQKRRGGERPAPGAVRAAPLLLPHGRPAVRGERAGREGWSPHGAAVRRRRRWSGATTARRGVPMRPSAMDLDVAPATTSAARRLAQPQYPRRCGSSAPPVLPPAAARPRQAAVVAAQGERGGAGPDAREGGDVDGGGSLRRSNRPWGGRSPAAT